MFAICFLWLLRAGSMAQQLYLLIGVAENLTSWFPYVLVPTAVCVCGLNSRRYQRCVLSLENLLLVPGEQFGVSSPGNPLPALYCAWSEMTRGSRHRLFGGLRHPKVALQSSHLGL